MSERCEEKCGAYFLVTTFFFTEPVKKGDKSPF